MNITAIDQINPPIRIESEEGQYYITHEFEITPKQPRPVVLVTNYSNLEQYSAYPAYIDTATESIHAVSDEDMTEILKEIGKFDVSFVEIPGGGQDDATV